MAASRARSATSLRGRDRDACRRLDPGTAVSPWTTPCLTMREQIIIRISLRDDVPLRWPSREDYSARWPLPSKQRVAGSNPAGRAKWL
jgi:hypothetical protein